MTATRRADGWLPAQALPCTWMTAGILSFKLCEREYDCEHCPLDAALSGGEPGSGEAREEALARARLEFPPDRRYHVAHGWVLPLCATRARYGLDMFAARLLERVSTVVLPPAGSRLDRGRPACWIESADQFLPLPAPVSGQVVATNHRVQERPALLLSDPYDEGWLLEVRCDRQPNDDPALVQAAEIRAETTAQLHKLHAPLHASSALDARVGPTLADGGEPVVGLRRLLGIPRYRRVLRALLC